MKKRLLFITSIFPSYRRFLIEELSEYYDITIAASIPDEKTGFLTLKLGNNSIIFERTKYYSFKKIFYQKGLLNITNKVKPDIIIVSASARDLGYWILLLYTYFKDIKIISHGQGPFNKTKNFLIRFQYSLIQLLSYRYVVYTNYSLNCLKELKLSTKKTRVVENTILNKYPIASRENQYEKTSILFIGRLRNGSNLDILIQSILNLKEKYSKIECHIIGGGELEQYYKSKYNNIPNIIWYGKLYSDSKIAQIARKCSIACYPGNTGLSVVHYLSLSLPVIIHNEIKKHQGPEASYIQDRYNGLLFDFENQNSLENSIESLILNNELRMRLSYNAYKTYMELSIPSYASKFIEIIEQDEQTY